MNYENSPVKIVLINLAIGMTVLTAVLIFIFSFFQVEKLETIMNHYQAINQFVQRLIALVLLVVSWNLYHRKRTAWLLVLVLLSVNLFTHFILHHNLFSTAIILMEVYILLVLVVFHQYFSRPSKKRSIWQAALISAVGILVVVINAVYQYLTLQQGTGKNFTLWESVQTTVRVFFGLEGFQSTHRTFEAFMFSFFWLCLGISLFIVMHSATLVRAATQREKEQARQLVNQYGQNPGSYLTLENDKTLFFGKLVPGVVAYGTVGDVIIVNGDPICRPEDFPVLLAELKEFCRANAYQLILLGTTSAFLTEYTSAGFHHVKCGEEARFDLPSITLAGGKAAKLRANVNHANKAGLITCEYKPQQQRDAKIEQELSEVTRIWLSGKKSSELSFTVGGPSLSDPLDRRYFYARDPQGKVVAFVVFLPFAGQNGYMADVTRRLPDAPGGAIEKLVYDAFEIFKEEGKLLGSMGLAPLSNVREEGTKDTVTAKLLDMIYEKFNHFYGFKDLRLAKEKYNPTYWEPGYFVYFSPSITPQMAYGIIRIQNSKGILDYIRGFFHDRKIKSHKPAEHSEAASPATGQVQ